MLNISFLRNILILSLLLAAGLPLFEVLFTHRSYQELLIQQTEAEAIRFVDHLTRHFRLAGRPFDRTDLPPDLERQVGYLLKDARLKKFRLFSSSGEIIFSTEEGEVGTINRHDYFHDVVARGDTFSKVVRKDQASADSQVFSTDVVETYVPIMPGGRFGGAVEVYSDITGVSQRIQRLNARSVGLLSGLSAILLLTMLGILLRAGREIQAREQAENGLQRSMEKLELMVETRTGELSQALSAEEQAHRRLEGIIQAMGEGLVVVDGEGRIVLINRTAEKILGLSGVPSHGQKALEVIWHDQILKHIDPVLQTGAEPLPFDFSVSSQGHPEIYRCRINVIANDPEKASGLILLFHEITREREMERMKEAFLAMAAHELHTPLSIIIGYSELLQREEGRSLSESQHREYLHLLHEKSLHLSRIVDDLLDVSLVASGRSLRLKKTLFHLVAEIAKGVRQFQDRFPGFDFVLEIGDQDLQISADQHRIHQVLDNLLDNAVKYSPPGSAITVRVDREGGSGRVTVSDPGIGMTPEQAEQAFELFYRVDTSDTAVRGTGLGLSIARHIVEAHGGRIWVESMTGNGATVRFTIPLAGSVEDNQAPKG